MSDNLLDSEKYDLTYVIKTVNTVWQYLIWFVGYLQAKKSDFLKYLPQWEQKWFNFAYNWGLPLCLL